MTTRLDSDLRLGLQRIVRQAHGDLSALWSQVRDAAAAGVALHDLLPGLIDAYGQAAATLATDWYDELRHKVEAPGSFFAVPGDIPDSGAHALVGWALAEATSDVSLQSLILGGTTRRILNFSRLTLTQSAVADPAARGWQRTGTGACDFCAMLIGRGAVYTEASADFAAHDSCKCSAVPAFGGHTLPVKPYTPSVRQSKADQDRARQWIADHL